MSNQYKTRHKENGCFSGDNSERVPPDPIPNSEVKTLCADDSVSLSCESRSSPDLILKPSVAILQRVFFIYKKTQAKKNLG